jgi:hypothetical protein
MVRYNSGKKAKAFTVVSHCHHDTKNGRGETKAVIEDTPPLVLAVCVGYESMEFSDIDDNQEEEPPRKEETSDQAFEEQES